MALEYASVERFHKKFKSLDGVIYGEGGNIKPEFRGKNIGARAMLNFGKWLVHNYKMKCFYINLTGAYMLRGMLKAGFHLEHSMYYDEFEYEGEKPFLEVEKNKIYNEPDRPASYLLAIYDKDIMKLLEKEKPNV